MTPDAFPPLLGTVDPVESASGKMVFRLLAVLAEFERDQISERTKSAMAYKKANGEKVGPTPFGFDKVDGKIIPNEAELNVVKKMRMLRAKRLSYQRIADDLNENGIPTKNKGKQWFKAGVSYILKTSAQYDQVLAIGS